MDTETHKMHDNFVERILPMTLITTYKQKGNKYITIHEFTFTKFRSIKNRYPESK